MGNLLILGAGGHGKVVSEIAMQTNYWENIAFLDDRENLNKVLSISVLGKFSEYNSFKKKYKYAFVAIGNNKLRLNWIERLAREGFIIPTLVHPFSFISKTSSLGEGTVVMAGAVVNGDTNIGKGCIINTSSSVDHDCILNDGVHISPGGHIGGTVTIDKCTWVGIGSSIVNNIHIGKNVLIASGASVIKNISDNIMVAGVPAEFKKHLGVNDNE